MPTHDTQLAAGYRPPPLITLSGALVAHVHTVFGFIAFGGALLVALSLHYPKVVKNGIAGWPDEYWPSVSATIGDWYPERNVFQIGIALMAGPRFALVLLSSLLVSLSKPTSWHARILAFVGCLRTFACGGWVYVTSTDDHDVHDIMMGLYLILTPPWMYITSGSLAAQPNKEALLSSGDKLASHDMLATKARKMRRLAAGAFFGMTPFMVLFFYRHKVLEIPGAYTHYAFFEWGLIIFDLLFDCASMYDLSRLEIQIVEARAPAVAKTETGSAQPLVGGIWYTSGTYEAVSRGAWTTPPNVAQDRHEKSGKTLRNDRNLKTVPTLVDIADFAAQCYLGFMFWSSLTALHLEIFFFSVYNMGIGGHEVLLVIQLLALGVMLIPPIQQWLMPASVTPRMRSAPSSSSAVGAPRLSALIVTYTFCLLGFLVWNIDDALARLIATALSCVGFSVSTAISWGRAWECGSVEEGATTFVIGLIMASVSKYANHSNNPAWPILDHTNGGHNLIAALLGLAAVSYNIARAAKQPSRPSTKLQVRINSSRSQRASAVLALGALIFILHVALSDSGTLIAWTWTGYPISGPMAITHGWIVLTISSLSVALSTWRPSMALSPLFWVFGAFSFSLVYAYEDHLGFLGACGAAFFLPPLATPLIRLAMEGHPIKTMWLVWLVADIMSFLHVLTAAYAFVPGGKIMREKLWLMLLLTITFLIAGLRIARRRPWAKHSKMASKSLTHLAAGAAVLVILAASLVPSFRTVKPETIVPSYGQERVFGAGIWTVHFSLDQSMRDSTRRMAAIIDDLKLDVVGLLETDLHRTVFGNRDLTQYLAEDLKMYADIGPGPDKHTWGAVLLSRFPIINSTHHLLPSPNGELAPAIHAVLDIFGVHTHVIVSHNGQEEDPLDRELQTTEIARILREAHPHPAVFLGYVVTRPHARRPDPYEILFQDGRIQDVDPHDHDRWCQYIGFRGLYRVAYARVSRYSVTDTELQTAKFRVPSVGDSSIDPDKDALPSKTIDEPTGVSWLYPRTYIDPTGLVYAKHMYFPSYYPFYFKEQ